jgi:hypothetical protein
MELDAFFLRACSMAVLRDKAIIRAGQSDDTLSGWRHEDEHPAKSYGDPRTRRLYINQAEKGKDSVQGQLRLRVSCVRALTYRDDGLVTLTSGP